MTFTTNHRARPAGYTFTYTLQTRFSDFDLQGHINNAVYLTYCESARVTFLRHIIGPENTGWVVAETRCRYVVPVELGATVIHVHLSVIRLGTSSITLGFAMQADADPHVVADGDATQVHIDSQTHRPLPIPETWRQRLFAFEAANGGSLTAST